MIERVLWLLVLLGEWAGDRLAELQRPVPQAR